MTANKAMIAIHGKELAQLAEDNHVQLVFESAVAGGIPALKLLREGLAANDIYSVSGILNGTCNYILSTMEETGRAFDDVLERSNSLAMLKQTQLLMSMALMLLINWQFYQP